MPLRLRRGTNTERQSITPQEGELIYVTDTKELWAGDGSTQGGIKVTGIVPERLNDLSDVNLSIAPQIGQVLKWNGSAFVAADDIDTNTGTNTNTDTTGIVEGGNYRINIVSDDSTIMVDTFTRIFTGNFIGDASGLVNFPVDVGIVPGGNYNISIVGDDSSIIINSADNSLTTNDIYHSENALIIKNSNNLLRSVIEVNSDDELARLVIARASAEIIDDTMVYGRLDFKKDDPNGPLVTGAIGADNLGLFFTYSSSGIGETESEYVTFSANSNFGIGTWSPTEKLDVRGNGIFTGTVTASSFKGSIVTDDSTTFVDAINGTISASGYIQFGSYTTIERDLLNAVNGMVIYNSTTDRFQGYQNNVWINLDDGSVA